MFSNALAFDDYGYDNDQYGRYSAMNDSNDYDEDQYPSYENHDYQSVYQSYVEDRDKSKDNERNVVSTSNVNCNTVNYNFNNVAIENFSNGNSGIGGSTAASDDGTNGALNANSNGNNRGGGYYDGYQKDKDITCITNINNNNTSIGGTGGNGTNSTGSQGPVGPQGPPGIQGLQGPAGPNVINATNTYDVSGPIVFPSSTNPIAQSIASCDKGDIVLEGTQIVVTFKGNLSNVERFSSGTVSGNSSQYFVSITAVPNTVVSVESKALCFDNPPLRSTLASSAVSTFQQQSETLPMMSQAIENSSKLTALEKQPINSQELTAMEKITKLKTQWLNQLQ